MKRSLSNNTIHIENSSNIRLTNGAWKIHAGEELVLSFNLNATRNIGFSAIMSCTSEFNESDVSLHCNNTFLRCFLVTDYYPERQIIFYVTSENSIKNNNTLKISVATGSLSALLIQSVDIFRFGLRQQEDPSWCWAATTVSLDRYFRNNTNANSNYIIDQCIFVGCIRGGITCCGSQPHVDCLGDGEISEGLEHFGIAGISGNNPATLDQIRSQISYGNPIVARILWPNNTGHVVVIWAFDEFNQKLVVSDPYNPTNLRIIPYDKFCNDYDSGSLTHGIWSHYYFTTPHTHSTQHDCRASSSHSHTDL